MINKLSYVLATAALLVACGADDHSEIESAKVDYAADAQRIAQSSIIVDTHIDVPLKLAMNPQDLSKASEGGDFDYPRAVSGGLNAPLLNGLKMS